MLQTRKRGGGRERWILGAHGKGDAPKIEMRRG
jgi:hypothetical protein